MARYGALANYGMAIESSIAPHDMIILLDCQTGYCGEDWTEHYFIPAGINLDEFSHEEALENAQRFGSDGSYECPECGAEFNDESECPDCVVEMHWQENGNVEGIIYHYQLSKSGHSVNGGDPVSDVVNLIIKHGGVTINDDKALIYTSRLKQLVYIPETEKWGEYNILIEELKSSHGVKIFEFA